MNGMRGFSILYPIIPVICTYRKTPHILHTLHITKMTQKIRKINTEITCPNCKTKIDVEDIKYGIRDRIVMAINEVIKEI